MCDSLVGRVSSVELLRRNSYITLVPFLTAGAPFWMAPGCQTGKSARRSWFCFGTRVPFLRTTHAMNSAGSTNIPVHPYLAGKITPNPSTKSRRRRLGKNSTQVQNFRSQLAVVSARRRSKIWKRYPGSMPSGQMMTPVLLLLRTARGRISQLLRSQRRILRAENSPIFAKFITIFTWY